MKQNLFIRRTKEDVLRELKELPTSYHMYLGWDEEMKERFLSFCMGKKTLPVLYDTVFKKLMHPDLHPERLEDCLSCLLKQKVAIKEVLPMEDILMDGETLMVMDILVMLDDGALVLVEIQKVPYYFPAERASCYSADLLLRQYSRTKSQKGKDFHYKDLRKVYTIVFYEKTTVPFHHHPHHFVHHARTVCDSGLELNFLQEFYLIALDVFQKSEYAKDKNPKDRLTGWLSFFCTESAEEAEALCLVYPWLSEIYAEMAQFTPSKELIGMFSEMLREMDRNTVRYMVDDMNEQIERNKVELVEIKGQLSGAKEELANTKDQLADTKDQLADAKDQLADAKDQLADAKDQLADAKEEIARLQVLLNQKI